jgi:hypothetical protein
MSADTSPDMARRYSQMIMALPPERRVAMCFQMSETARAIVRRSLESAGLGPDEIGPAFAQRLYGSTLSPQVLAGYAERLRGRAGRKP